MIKYKYEVAIYIIECNSMHMPNNELATCLVIQVNPSPTLDIYTLVTRTMYT